MTASGEREGTCNTREGNSLLHGLHGEMCQGGTEYSAMRPVALPPVEMEGAGPELAVVFMEWCSDCGAAAWERVE